MREREKLAKVKHLYSASSPVEDIVAFLRKERATKIESVRLLHLGTGMSLAEAKKTVFLSKTWSDRFESDEQFLDALLQDVERAPRSRAAA